MDVVAIRHANLNLLLKEIRHTRPGRLQKHLAADLGLSPSYLSQLVKGKKMGDDVARKIEQARKLPHGWMDQQQVPDLRIGEPASAYDVSQSVRTNAGILASAMTLVRLTLENLEEEFDPEAEADAWVVLLACNYLQARNEHTVSAENVVDFTKIIRRRQQQGEFDGQSTGASRTRNSG